MRYFLYCRKSSDRDDKQMLSLEAQQRKMLEVAEKLNLEIVEVFIEQKSAYKVGRPKFNEMMKRLQKGDADAILTYHLSRLARNSYDGGNIIYFMDEKIIKEIRTWEGAHHLNPEAKFMLSIHFAVSKKSSDDTSQFVKRDIETKLRKGELPGAAPLGYLNIDQKGTIAGKHYSQDKQRLLFDLNRPLRREEIDPINGPIVQKIFQQASTGMYTLKKLRALSYELGLRSKTGNKLPEATVYAILTNPYYYGVIRFNGNIYTENIQHEPLISKQLFDRVQQLLKRRGKGSGMRRHFFPYTGLFHCGECGGAITAENQKGHTYYHCTYRKGPCSQRTWLKSEDLEEQLLGVIRQLVIPPAFLEFAFKRLKDVHKHESDVQNIARQNVERRYGQLKTKLDALLEMKLASNNTKGEMLSDQEYMERKATLRNEMVGLEQQREAFKNSADTWLGDCEKFMQFTQELCTKYGMATLEQKKELMFLLCSKGIITNGSVAFSYREPFASIAKFPLAGSTRFEPPESLSLKKKSALVSKWLPRLFLVRTIIDACVDTPSPIVYVGEFRRWSEEVKLLGEEDRLSMSSQTIE